jgi:2-methylisocitrate lyase-like PEP mutase family enzyme
MSPELRNQQIAKSEVFRNLHADSSLMIVPNAWDAGSAKILTDMGFLSLATTSAGLAYTMAKPDGSGAVKRNAALENAATIVSATHLPVTADLENGYGDAPGICAETILLASETGLVGGSIEDATGNADKPIYDYSHAVERIIAAVDAARSLPFHFTITARAENYLHGKLDLDDTIKRLVAYANAGADVLFAPGIKSKEEIQEIVRAVSPRPVNVLMGFADSDLTIDDVARLGVQRVSVGSSFARAALGGFYRAALEVKEKGSFGYAKNAISYAEVNAMFGSNDL